MEGFLDRYLCKYTTRTENVLHVQCVGNACQLHESEHDSVDLDMPEFVVDTTTRVTRTLSHDQKIQSLWVSTLFDF